MLLGKLLGKHFTLFTSSLALFVFVCLLCHGPVISWFCVFCPVSGVPSCILLLLPSQLSLNTCSASPLLALFPLLFRDLCSPPAHNPHLCFPRTLLHPHLVSLVRMPAQPLARSFSSCPVPVYFGIHFLQLICQPAVSSVEVTFFCSQRDYMGF